MMTARYSDERGSVNTIGALVALALLSTAVVMGTSFYRSTSTLSVNTGIHQRERAEAATLKAQLRRDADVAQAIYFPSASSPLGEPGCPAIGPCDQIRFAAQRPDKTWTFWGYYSDPANDRVYRCGYASSEATTCAGVTVLDGAVAFRGQALAATAIAAAIPTFASSGVTDYTGNLSYSTTDSRVVASNRVMVVQFANSTSGAEVHLIANPQATRVALAHGTYNAASRAIAAQNTSVPGMTFSFSNNTAPAQNGLASEDRYNDAFLVGRSGGPYASPTSYSCMAGASSIATVNFGSLSHNASNALQQPNSGVVSVLPFTVTPNGANAAGGTCTFVIHSAKANAGDTVDATLTVVLSPTYGPVIISPGTITTNTNQGQAAVISQTQWSGAYTITASTCAGIANVSITGSTLNVVGGSSGNQSCNVTVAGAPGAPSATVPITVTWPSMTAGAGTASIPTQTSLRLTTSPPSGGNGVYAVSYYFQGSSTPISGCASIAINAACTVSGLTASTGYTFVPRYNDSAGSNATGSPFTGTTAALVTYSINISPSRAITLLTGQSASWTAQDVGSDGSFNAAALDRITSGACTFATPGWQPYGTTFTAATAYSANASTCALNMMDQFGTMAAMTFSLVGHYISATGGTASSSTVPYSAAEIRTDNGTANLSVSVPAPCTANGATTFAAGSNPIALTANVPSSTSCTITITDDIGSPAVAVLVTNTVVSIPPPPPPPPPSGGTWSLVTNRIDGTMLGTCSGVGAFGGGWVQQFDPGYTNTAAFQDACVTGNPPPPYP